MTSLAGELSPTDDQTREQLCNAFQRWQTLLHEGIGAMRDRGDLRPETDLDEVSMAMLSALQGGSLLSQTLQTAEPMRASMKAALAYVRSFATGAHAGR